MKKQISPIILIAAAVLFIVLLISSSRLAGSSQLTGLSSTGGNTVTSRALSYYYEKTGEAASDSILATSRNFGCHTEFYIQKDGNIAMTLYYINGQFYKK